jgi:hypothetical protein
MALIGAVLLAGCSSGTPKAASPETKYDFGDVPVVTDMSQGKTREFVIKNEGTGDLKITGVQVKLLQGC